MYIAPIPGLGELNEVFACADGHRSFALPSVAVYEEGRPHNQCAEGCPPEHGTVALAGTIVAYAESYGEDGKYEPCYCGNWHVVVRNLRTGHIIHRRVTGGTKLAPTSKPYETPEPGDYVGVGPAVDIDVRPNGSVAWIAKNFGYDGMQAGYEVHVVDSHGGRILAHSPHIAPHSLKITGNKIQWGEDGVTMSSRFR